MLSLDLFPSRRLTVVFTGVYMLALAGVWIVALPWWNKPVLSMILLASLAGVLSHHVLRRSARSIVHLHTGDEGRLRLTTRAGVQHEVQVLNNSFVTPWLTIIVYRQEGAWFARSVLITPDSALAEPYRQIRVWLKWALGQDVPLDSNPGWAGRL